MEVIKNRFQLHSQIGKGCWSVVKKATDTISNAEVAVKLEVGVEPERSLLLREAKILKHLEGIDGIPVVIDFGSSSTQNYIAMELLDTNLEQLYRTRKLGCIDVMEKAEQLIASLEAVHSKHIVHQDLKPKNLMVKGKQTYLIDFGLATKVKKLRKNAPRTKGMLGTPSFASLAALLGMSQFPKDDLEALGYVIIWLLRGKLPWEVYVTESNLSGLKTMKFHASVRQICQNCPDEMVHYFSYIKGVKENNRIDYNYLKSLFEAAHRKFNFNKLIASPLIDKRTPQRQRIQSYDLTLLTVSGRTPSNSRSIFNSPADATKTSRYASQDRINSLRPSELKVVDKSFFDLSLCSIGDLQGGFSKALDSNFDGAHSYNDLPRTDDSPVPIDKSIDIEEFKLTPKVSAKPPKLVDARRTSKRLKTISELHVQVPMDLSDSQRTKRVKFEHSLTVEKRMTFCNAEVLDTEPAEEMPQITPKLKRRLKTMSKASDLRKEPTQPESSCRKSLF